jgi:hypothetical protein
MDQRYQTFQAAPSTYMDTRTCRMPVTVPSMKAVDAALPGNGFGVPDIYVSETEKDEKADRLFLDSDGDYGEETCED